MSYSIDYRQADAGRSVIREKNYRLQMILCVGILLVILTGILWPDVGRAVRDAFLPGDPIVTAAAFDLMADRLAQGDSVKDAITIFCREIIEGAAVQ